VKSLAPIDFAACIRQPVSRDLTDDKDIQSSEDEGEATTNIADSTRGGKEETAETPKITRRRGSGRVRGAGGKILDSCRLETQHRVELDAPPEATTTIQMPTARYP
jgi:hypothetical protein